MDLSSPWFMKLALHVGVVQCVLIVVQNVMLVVVTVLPVDVCGFCSLWPSVMTQ